VSYAFHYDFSTSFLIFAALVNIHHFILDGAIWKLRDSRIATLLVDRESRGAARQASKGARQAGARAATGGGTSWRTIRAAAALLLLAWAAVDVYRFYFGTAEGNLPELEKAASLTPYDGFLDMRIARAEMNAGEASAALDALARAVKANPGNPGFQNARAQALIQQNRYPEAYEHYKQMLKRFPRDADALVNFGLLASQEGRVDEAIDSWNRAIATDPKQLMAQLYLAATYDRAGETIAAVPHYAAFLHGVETPGARVQIPMTEAATAAIQLGDDDAKLNRADEARQSYGAALRFAQKADDARITSLALVHLADLQEKIGDAGGAAEAYQQALRLDARSGDPHGEAADWFDYGQFLLRQHRPEELAYACFLRSEFLLKDAPGPDTASVERVAKSWQSKLGRKAAEIERNADSLREKALALPSTEFGSS
jgi:tetratricopeptide (TPR) repeat protein